MALPFLQSSLAFLLFLLLPLISIQIPLNAFLYKITTADCKYTEMFGSNPEEQCRKILDKSHFQTVRKLGKGSFGHVILASKFTTSHNFYAIKCISLKKCMKDPHLKRYISQETKTMCSLNHPNIVRLQNSFSDCGYHFIVMEYCDLGNLLQYQAKLPQRIFSFGEALRVLHQIMRGVQAIHHRNIIHRDLKCENIFLQKNKNGSYKCKIGDFGLAKVVQDTTKTSCGTIYFMAPEVILHEAYDHQADIWSIGVIFYYTLFGEYPFKSMNIQKQIEMKCKDRYDIFQYQKNYELKYKKDEEKVRNFFERVFVINPKQRMTLNEMFNHSFFQSVQAQTTQDSTDDQLQQDVELELQKIEFIEKVQDNLTKLNIIEEVILSAFRFYLLKVIKTFLNEKFVLQFLKEQPQSKLSKEIIKKNQIVDMEMKMLIKFLQPYRSQLSKIERFNEGFNLETQDFSSFKQGYRNTVGKVYEQVHKRIPQGTKRAQMKFKIFCCHLINRVFKLGLKRECFPCYTEWNKQQKKVSKKSFDFALFEEWIENESNEKLVGSIDYINKIFYKKD